jgi:hypothetical protein
MDILRHGRDPALIKASRDSLEEARKQLDSKSELDQAGDQSRTPAAYSCGGTPSHPRRRNSSAVA